MNKPPFIIVPKNVTTMIIDWTEDNTPLWMEVAKTISTLIAHAEEQGKIPWRCSMLIQVEHDE